MALRTWLTIPRARPGQLHNSNHGRCVLTRRQPEGSATDSSQDTHATFIAQLEQAGFGHLEDRLRWAFRSLTTLIRSPTISP